MTNSRKTSKHRVVSVFPPAPTPETPPSGLRQGLGEAVDRVADLIKETLLDGIQLSGEDDNSERGSLPPLDVDSFVKSMQPRVEAALRRLAEVVNAAPAEALLPTSEDATCNLFNALWWEALTTAVRLREQAGSPMPPPPSVADGKWATRYRQMLSQEPLPPAH